MADESSAQTVREAVGVFHDRDSFKTAVDELMSAGFDRAELSLLASDRSVEEKLGHAYQRVEQLEDDVTVPRAAYADNHSLAEARTGIIGGLAYIGATAAAGVVVASGGTLAAVVAAAAVAGGGSGLVGGWAARFLGQKEAGELQAQIDRGGLLLWVRVVDSTREQRALDILRKRGAADVHVHELPLSADPDANPLTGLQIDPALPDAKI